MKKKAGLLLSLALASGAVLTGCGNNDATDTNDNAGGNGDADGIRVGMVADVGGIDDRSFNQSTWEGLKLFAEENGLEVNEDLRFQSSESDADYVPNLTLFAEQGFDLTFGVGFLLADPLATVAEQFPDSKFAIIDSVVKADNVVSINFEEHVGSFLVGVAAAMTTETNTVGFIGGVDSELIHRFEVGFVQGVKSVNPDIEVIVSYANDFNAADVGTTLASAMYTQGADIIFHAAGGTGNGVFTEAINRAQNGENVWVIGVDRDQSADGEWRDGDTVNNVTLTSMLKRVDVAANDIATKTLEGNFPGGQTIVYGLEDDGVGVVEDNLSEEILARIEDYRQQILDGEIEVISTRAEMFEMFPEME